MALNFHHIAVQVNDISEVVEWYKSNLGATVINQFDDWAMMEIGGLRLSLTLKNHPNHIAFEVENVDQFPCNPEEVKAHRDGSLFYYQEAPDGTIIEWLYWPAAKP